MPDRCIVLLHTQLIILRYFLLPCPTRFHLPESTALLLHQLLCETCFVSFFQASSGNYYFIPYIVTPCADYFCCESDAQRRASEYMQPNWDTILGPLCVPLVDRFISLLKDIHVTSW